MIEQTQKLVEKETQALNIKVDDSNKMNTDLIKQTHE